jgi:hypothetical protein
MRPPGSPFRYIGTHSGFGTCSRFLVVTSEFSAAIPGLAWRQARAAASALPDQTHRPEDDESHRNDDGNNSSITRNTNTFQPSSLIGSPHSGRYALTLTGRSAAQSEPFSLRRRLLEFSEGATASLTLSGS